MAIESGRYGSFVGCRMKVNVWCGRRWVICSYERGRLIAFSSWRVRLQIWRGVMRSVPYIWQRRCNTAPSWC